MEKKKAQERSEMQVRPRLSTRIYSLQRSIERGRSLEKWLAKDKENWWHNWNGLHASEQDLFIEYYTGNMSRMKNQLKAQQKLRGQGAGESMAVSTYMPSEQLY